MKEGRKPSQKKVNAVKEIKELVSKYKVIGLLNMENMPNLQLKRIKNKLKEKMLIKVYKKRIIPLALSDLKETKKNIEQLNQHIQGIPSLVFTSEDPFKLQKLFSKSKSKAPAKAGQTAPTDLVINSGPTSFTPGPIISELAQFGLKTEVKEGKVAIKTDKLLVKEGAVIDQKSADLLSKLGMEPMEIGLNLLAAYDNGLIYLKDVLSIDEKTYINNLKQASMDSFNLAIAVSYITNETVKHLIKKASRESKALSSKVDLSKTVEKKPKIKEVKEVQKEKVKPEAKEPIKEKIEIKEEIKPEIQEPKKPTADILVKEAEKETKDDVKEIEKLTRDILSGKLKR